MDPDIHSLVATEATRLSLQLEPPTLALLAHYVALLSRWGQRLNLTSDPSPLAIIQHHLADGLMLSQWLREDEAHWQRLQAAAGGAAVTAEARAPAVDVGSGAGLPGLVLALARPELQLTLVEPNTRKSSFLRTAAHELQLPLRVLSQRLEQVQLAPQVLACSRATFSPARWLSLAGPLLAAGGLAVAFLVQPQDVPPPTALLTLVDCYRYTLVDNTPRALAIFVRT